VKCHHKKVKVKASHTLYRALGPELIPLYSQSACRSSPHVVGCQFCHYFLLGLQLIIMFIYNNNNNLSLLLSVCVKVEQAMKLWTESESLTSDMAVSFESLRSMCSDREQVWTLLMITSHQFSWHSVRNHSISWASLPLMCTPCGSWSVPPPPYPFTSQLLHLLLYLLVFFTFPFLTRFIYFLVFPSLSIVPE